MTRCASSRTWPGRAAWLLLRLPAHDWLRGRHDVAVHTRHRYTTGEVAGEGQRAGFQVVRLSYANCLLFPLALAKRALERVRPPKRRLGRRPAAAGQQRLTGVLSAEAAWLRRLARCPGGCRCYAWREAARPDGVPCLSFPTSRSSRTILRAHVVGQTIVSASHVGPIVVRNLLPRRRGRRADRPAHRVGRPARQVPAAWAGQRPYPGHQLHAVRPPDATAAQRRGWGRAPIWCWGSPPAGICATSTPTQMGKVYLTDDLAKVPTFGGAGARCAR